MTSIVITARSWSPRAHPVPAAVVLLSVVSAGVAVTIAALLALTDAPREDVAEIATTLAYVVPYALVGAFLVVRRPDLPFGWLLSGCAAIVAVGIAVASQSYAALSDGSDDTLVKLGSLLVTVQWLPVAVQGLVNVWFPSGRVTSRFGGVLNRLLVVGIALGVMGGVLGNWSLDLERADGTTATMHNPLTDGTIVGDVASVFTVAIPLVILVGLIAGLSIVRRAWTATGIERDQLRWRAFGVVLSLALYPVAIAQALPIAVSLVDGLLFTTTLVIPIVYFRLWAIDNIIRRSAAYLLVTVLVAGLFAALAASVAALQGERVGLVAAAVITALVFGPALRPQPAPGRRAVLRPSQRSLPCAERPEPATRRRGRAGRCSQDGRHGSRGVASPALRRDRATGRRIGACQVRRPAAHRGRARAMATRLPGHGGRNTRGRTAAG